MPNRPIHTCPWSDRCYTCLPITPEEKALNWWIIGIASVLFVGLIALA